MKDLGTYRFTFAVIADTHVNQSETFSSSPYPSNALANARTRRVVAELNRAKPEFVVHLGDIVNPVPELPTYQEAAEHFKTLVAGLEAPLHIVPGNHDVGDKPVSWMPAGQVTAEHLSLYESHFGAHFYSFGYADLHFIVLNAPIMNSGLDAEAEQRAWLEAELAASADKRVMLCIHYPPYVSNPDEYSTYDNIDEPARSWLLKLIEAHAPEAVFCGHVHNFWYDRIGDCEMYILPSTAFVRHDYQELFRIPPGEEYGRNDGPKLGWFLVRVYQHGHVVENIRTYGRTLGEGAVLPAPENTVARLQPKEGTREDIAIDMRQPWAEEIEVTPSGAVDEFERKLTRNDYPVLALWEMGVKRLRLPVQDLVNPKIRRRMQVLGECGYSFHIHCYGVPQGERARALREYKDLYQRLELVLPWDEVDGAAEAIASLRADIALPVMLSRVNRRDAGKHQSGRFNHLISHGFQFDECDELQAFFATEASRGIDGIMFQVPREQAPREAAHAAGRFHEATGRETVLYLKTSAASPYEAFEDDVQNACRMAEAVFATAGTGGVDVVLDTFADADRGYFARAGLVDRLYNPKLGSAVLGNLIGLLGTRTWRRGADEDAGPVLGSEDGARLVLLTGHGSPSRAGEYIDLGSGIVHQSAAALTQTAAGPWVSRTPPRN